MKTFMTAFGPPQLPLRAPGLVPLYLFPNARNDVTLSLRLPSRWPRFFVRYWPPQMKHQPGGSIAVYQPITRQPRDEDNLLGCTAPVVVRNKYRISRMTVAFATRGRYLCGVLFLRPCILLVVL